MNGFKLVIGKLPFLDLNSRINSRTMMLVELGRAQFQWYHHHRVTKLDTIWLSTI
jgi:hypothetical protein